MTLDGRTVATLRKTKWLVAKVTWYESRCRTTYDLFGIFDVLAVRDTVTLAVQCTANNCVAARVEKMELQQGTLRKLIKAGWVLEIWGWRSPTQSRRFWNYRLLRAKKVRGGIRFKEIEP